MRLRNSMLIVISIFILLLGQDVSSGVAQTRSRSSQRFQTDSKFLVTSGFSMGFSRPENDRAFVLEASVDAILIGGDLKFFPFNYWGGIYGSIGSFNGTDIRGEFGGQLGFMMFSIGIGYTQISLSERLEHGFSVHSKFPIAIFVPYLRYSHYDSYEYFEGGISLKFPIPIGFGREVWGID